MKLASLIVQAPSPPLPTGYSAALNDILQRQEKPRLDSLHTMRHVQEMSPRQRRRIRKEEPRETYMMKMK
ncbi:hypothetical protein FKM82_025177 [Ascaphus truei]